MKECNKILPTGRFCTPSSGFSLPQRNGAGLPLQVETNSFKTIPEKLTSDYFIWIYSQHFFLAGRLVKLNFYK